MSSKELVPQGLTEEDLRGSELVPLEEIVVRESNGVRVAMRWDPNSRSTSVGVLDSGRDVEFTLDGDATQIKDLYDHPFYYAARQGKYIEGPEDAVEARVTSEKSRDGSGSNQTDTVSINVL
jgi:hypothetical protein